MRTRGILRGREEPAEELGGAMPDAEVSLQLLGGFRLMRRGVPVRVTSSRIPVLLARLVLFRSVPQSRLSLASLFWPESSDAQARTNLRKLLLELRRTLPETDRFVRIDGQLIAWRPDAPCRVDVEEFQRAVAGAATPAELERGVALYGGDLLPDSYDDWVLVERERLRQVYLQALGRVVEALESQQAYREAAAYAHQLMVADPVREEAYRTLMRLHVLRGDRAEAVRVYHRCAAVLQQELGVGPSPATREAYDRAIHADTRPPEEVFEAPPLPPHNLPAIVSPFVGREAETAEVSTLLSTCRLVTLTGPGGCGKTRLALRVAERLLGSHPDGVWVVDSAPLGDPTWVVPTVARVVGVQEEQGRPLGETLARALRSKAALLVLDNCERLVEAWGALVGALLPRCPRLRVLVTSRQPLNVPGERVWRTPPLALPPSCEELSVDQLARVDAVRLFMERASAVRPGFRLTPQSAKAVCEICRRLDGLPLAIELAAARVKALSVHQIAARLHALTRLLGSAGPAVDPRHRTLEAACDWSYALLSDAEKRLLRRLTVFAGGWTLEAAERVCGGDGLEPAEVLDCLAELVDKSLVEVEAERDEARYRLLEVLRQYYEVKWVAAGEASDVRRRHLAYYAEAVEGLRSRLWGPEQAAGYDWAEREHDNLRAALAWALQHDPPRGLRVAGALWRFWKMRNHATEGRRWLEQFLQRAPDPTLDRAYALEALGYLASDAGDHEAARPALEEALEIFRRHGDAVGTARTLTTRGIVAMREGDFQGARASHRESLLLYRGRGDNLGAAYALNNLGLVEANQGRLREARRAFEESLALFRQAGDPRGAGIALTNLGNVLCREGELAAARAVLEEGLAVKRRLGEIRGLVVLLEEFAGLAAAEGAAPDAVRLYGAADAAGRQSRLPSPLSDHRAHHLDQLAILRASLGEEAFRAAWAEGQRMALLEALDHGQKMRPPAPPPSGPGRESLRPPDRSGSAGACA